VYVVSVVTVGRVPLATRVEGENVIPGGSPDRLYSYGALPPVAAGNKVLTTPPDGTREFGMPGRDSGGTDAGGRTVAVKTTEAEAPAPSLTV